MTLQATGTPAVLTRIEGSEKSALALKMRRQGHSTQDIAEVLGVQRRWVNTLIGRALKEIVTDDVQAWRALEVVRLEHLTQMISTRLEQQLEDRDDGTPGHLDLRAVDRLVALSVRRSKLLGLDMPVKLEVGKSTGPVVIEVADFNKETHAPDIDDDGDVEVQARLAPPSEEGVDER